MERTYYKNIIMVALLALLVTACGFLLMSTNVYAAVDEQEKNDTYETANPIKVGQVVYGYNDSYDKDYFVFTAPISGTITFKGWLDSCDTPRAGIACFHVYDSNMNKVGSVSDDLEKPTGESFKFGVTYGKKYYIVEKIEYEWFTGTYHFSTEYYIGPTTATLKSKDNAFYIKWDKKNNASFYQIRYTKKSTYDDYAWAKSKTVNVDKKYGSKTIKNLSNKKKYYVTVRVARTIDGVTYYSAWSKRMAVTTK